jgi:HEAT repeats/PilZ domain
MRNKRQHARFDVVELHGRMLLADKVEIVDISLGGLSLKADRRLDLGREYQIKLGKKGREIAVRGVVVRSSLAGMETGTGGESVLIYAAGVKFREGQTDKIAAFLDSVDIRKTDAVSPAVERRLHVRFQITTSQKKVLLFPAHFRVREMSFHGMLVRSDSPLGGEGAIPLALFLDREHHIDFSGTISSTRTKEDGKHAYHETEITFPDLTDRDRGTLRKFIDYLAANPEAEFFQLSEAEAELVQVADVLRSLAKCIKAFATYPAGHAVYQRYAAELHAKLESYFSSHQDLPLKINKDSIIFRDREAYAGKGRNDNAALLLYIDGIREICFSRGLTLEELVDFIAILKRSSQKTVVDDDIVTLLWERDLKHFSYFVPEAIEDEDVAALEEKLLATQDERAQLVTGLRDVSIPSPSGEELKELRKQLDRLSGEHLLVEAIGLLLDLLASERDPAETENLARHIGQAFTMLLERNRLGKAVEILKTLKDVAASAGYGPALRGVLEDAGREPAIHAVLNSDGDPEDVERYLLLLNANAIEPLLDHLGSRQDRKMRRVICNALAVIGKQDAAAVAVGLKSPHWYVARNVAMILGAIKAPSGVARLSEAVRHPEARVRREAVKSLELIGSRETKRPLLSALDDPDPAIRTAVLKALKRLGGADVFERIRAVVSRDEHKKRPPAELRALFEALAGIDGEKALPLLARYFVKKGFLRKKESRELRTAAAYGLAVVGTPEALSLLRKEPDIGAAVLRKAGRARS